MKRIYAIFLPAAMLMANAVTAMDEDLSMKLQAECQKYAMEDSISAEDMDAYIEECVRDLAETAEAPDLSPSEVENEE
jgi:hypothetical protein